MSIVSARDFRQNMKMYLDSASRGENVIVSRGEEHFVIMKTECKVVPIITEEMKERIRQIRATPIEKLSVMSKTFSERVDLGTTDYKELLQKELEEKYL